MLELLGLAIGGFVVILVLGTAFKLLGLVAGLILLPIKLAFSIAGFLLTGALVLCALPFAVLGIVALLGGLAFLAIGILGAVFA
jgi:hypothetical protein